MSQSGTAPKFSQSDGAPQKQVDYVNG